MAVTTKPKTKRRSFGINLLPEEIRVAEKSHERQLFVRKVCIMAILMCIAISLAVTIFRFILNSQVDNYQKRYAQATQQIESQKTKEGLVVALHQRLVKIESLSSVPSKTLGVFNMLSVLTPATVKINQMSIDPTSKTALTAETFDTGALQTFTDNLIDPKKNNDQIARVHLENLNQSLDGKLRFDLTINLK